MSDKDISVIIPSKNGQRYLDRVLKAVFSLRKSTKALKLLLLIPAQQI